MLLIQQLLQILIAWYRMLVGILVTERLAEHPQQLFKARYVRAREEPNAISASDRHRGRLSLKPIHETGHSETSHDAGIALFREAPLQPLPALEVVLLQLTGFGCEARQAHGETALEHERHAVIDLVRL